MADLTDAQWAILEPLFPIEQTTPQAKAGRPWKPARDVLNGVLWIMRTGAQWEDLPDRYPPYQTCHRRFQGWVMDGTFEKLLATLARDLKERGGLDVSECFIDGTFVSARKGGSSSAKRSVERGPRSWQLQTALVCLSPWPSTAPLPTK